MRLLAPALFLALAAVSPSFAEPTPSPSPSAPLDRRTKEQAIEVERQLGVAMETKETSALEKLLDEHYFDAYEGGKFALSKAATIARCRSGREKFLAIEREERMTADKGGVIVEGLARLQPSRVDDRTPENEWIHVRRLWAKQDGSWRLLHQWRRRLGEDPNGADAD